MAETPVNGSGGVFGLGGSRDTDLQVPSGHRVFTTDKNLAQARQKYPNINWFACFSVRDENNNYATKEYTITFDAPAAGGAQHTLYYYDGATAQTVTASPAPNKGSKARLQAKLSVGDPPIGMT